MYPRPQTSARMDCGTARRRIFLRAARTYVPFKNCSVTLRSPRPRSIHMFRSKGSRRRMSRRTPERDPAVVDGGRETSPLEDSPLDDSDEVSEGADLAAEAPSNDATVRAATGEDDGGLLGEDEPVQQDPREVAVVAAEEAAAADTALRELWRDFKETGE